MESQGETYEQDSKFQQFRHNYQSLQRSFAGTNYIFCALRGPDSENRALKYLFTERLRGMLYCTFGNKRYRRLLNDKDLRRLLEECRVDIEREGHYITHICGAFETLSSMMISSKLRKECIALVRLAVDLHNTAKTIEEILHSDYIDDIFNRVDDSHQNDDIADTKQNAEMQ